MDKHNNITENDLVSSAIREQQIARAELLETSRALDKAVEAVDQAAARLAKKERQLLATQPVTKQGAAALLRYIASIIGPHEDSAGLALPALAGVREVLVQ